MKQILMKFISRKFLLCVAGFASGLYLIQGGDASTSVTVAGAISSTVSVVVFVLAEGRIDAERAKTAAEAVQNAVDAVKEEQ